VFEGLIASEWGWNRLRSPTLSASCCKLASSATQPAKRKYRLGFIVSQSKIQDVKVVPHVSAVCCASERQHPELDSETKYYLRNRLIVVTGDLGHAWFQENLVISGK